jgi:hypothetical protein
MQDNARTFDVIGRIHDTAQRLLAQLRPQCALRIKQRQMRLRTFEAVAPPPRDSVEAENDRASRRDEPRKRVRQRRQRVRLHRDEHDILRRQRRRIVSRLLRHAADFLTAGLEQHAVTADRLELHAARDDGHFRKIRG